MNVQQIISAVIATALIILFSTISPISVQSAQSASFISLGDLSGGTFSSKAYGVSADGSVVIGGGVSTNSVGGRVRANETEAFRWQNGVMTGLGDLPGGDFGSTAYGVSVDGSVVVGSSESANGLKPFRWQNGVMTGLSDLPGGADSVRNIAFAVSADGSVVVGVGSF